MLKYSYCKKHDTYPQDDEPCWACIRQFGGELNPISNAAEENQKNTKPCRVDGKTPCVQYPDDDCDCDPCEYCEIAINYERMKE